MHSAFRQSVVISLRSTYKCPTHNDRLQHATRSRCFHKSPSTLQSTSQDDGDDPNGGGISSGAGKEPDHITNAQAAKAEKGSTTIIKNPHRSASRRALRSRTPERSSKFDVPQWFVENNIYLCGDGYPTWAHRLVVVDSTKRQIFPPLDDLDIRSLIKEPTEKSSRMRQIVTKLEEDIAKEMDADEESRERARSVSRQIYRSQAEKIVAHRVFRGIKLSADLHPHEIFFINPHGNYHIDDVSFRDVFNVYSGLMPLPAKDLAKDPPFQKILLNLRFTGESGHNFFRSLVAFIAELGGADLIRLDAQDISELVGSWQKDCGGDFKTARLMSYDVYRPERVAKRSSLPSEIDESEETSSVDADQEQSFPMPAAAIRLPLALSRGIKAVMLNPSGSAPFNRIRPQWDRYKPSFSQLRNSLESSRSEDTLWKYLVETILATVRQRQQNSRPQPLISSSSTQRVMYEYLRRLLHSQPTRLHEREGHVLPPFDLKDMLPSLVDTMEHEDEIRELGPRSRPQEAQNPSNMAIKPKQDKDKNSPSNGHVRDIVIHVQDLETIQENESGRRFLHFLYDHVRLLRSKGQRVIIVGTSESGFSVSSPTQWNSAFDVGEYKLAHTLDVTPTIVDKGQVSETYIWPEKQRRIASVNLRHLDAMLRSQYDMHINEIRGGSALDDPSYHLSDHMMDEFSRKIFTFDETYHIATLLRSRWFLQDPSEASLDHVVRAAQSLKQRQMFNLLSSIPRHNFSLFDKLAEHEPPEDSENNGLEVDDDSGPRDKNNKVKRTYDRYEKKLLRGVLKPHQIRTTFADVNAPSKTIDDLQSLTALSIKRPDAFSYGVLSTDKISGLLLYGPPGTGKSLMAKIVAGQTGVNMIQVSSAEINDMYVGEAEKNIRALFSLAKKLNPCVIFIDEADALFGSRSADRARSSHREVINQFLKEWDGMNNDAGGAFIMVATNRPFDLDDAVLRRLPRRILVDLPTEPDRQKILQIHLKGENLAGDVDLVGVATRTPFYSGSDLKNVCVAAALNAVKDENRTASEHKSDEAYKHPERRTLRAAHFEAALDEVSASISEDMDSLKAIRKFDEQYGDSRMGRKKSTKWGFRTPQEQKTKRETIKVRD